MEENKQPSSLDKSNVKETSAQKKNTKKGNQTKSATMSESTMERETLSSAVIEIKSAKVPVEKKKGELRVKTEAPLSVVEEKTAKTEGKQTETSAINDKAEKAVENTPLAVAEKEIAKQKGGAQNKPDEKAIVENIQKSPKAKEIIQNAILPQKEHAEEQTKADDNVKKILFVTSEALPLIKTGGLGEVAGALPKALNELGCDARVMLPLYADIPETFKKNMKFVGYTYVVLAWRYQYCGVFEYKSETVTYYLLDNEYYFKRSALYGHYDDGERFSFFSKAVIEAMRVTEFYPDIVHTNDWQSALVPVFLDSFYRGYQEFKHIKTVFTIHNIEFQGKYGKEIIQDVLGLGECARFVEYQKCANFMKGAIETANAVTTVSSTYAGEIMQPFYSYKLDEILRQRQFKLSGIVNGIDTELYDPSKDPALFEHYDINSIEKKEINKKGLCEMLDLAYNEKRPVIGMVSRLTQQKGVDLIVEVLEKILSADLQLVILGTGDWKYQTALTDMQRKYPSKLRVIINFNSDLASKIYAGADMFLMPSKFEPCGLSQMIAMRYGCVPIVRETGGLKDTVKPFNSATKEGTGFTFFSYNAYDMLDAIWRAFGCYRDFKEDFKIVMKNGMRGDYSWKKSAGEYLELYNRL